VARRRTSTSKTKRQAALPATVVEEDGAVLFRGSAQRLTAYAAAPHPMPARGRWLDGFLYGASLPALGMRALLRDRGLRRSAGVPVAVLTALCAAAAGVAFVEDGPLAAVQAFYGLLTAAAPLSPILFTRVYARLAAHSRTVLGFEPREPYLRGFGQATFETFLQLVLLAIGILPIVAIIGMIPVVGRVWVVILGALWTGHWVVVEALDNARALAPGETREQYEGRVSHGLPQPWFARIYDIGRGTALAPLLAVGRIWGSFVGRLSRRWRSEAKVIENDPFIAAGLGAGAAVLLAIPIVNLLFRPAVVIAAATWHAQLELRDGDGPEGPDALDAEGSVEALDQDDAAPPGEGP
jgi:hypothetical protein